MTTIEKPGTGRVAEGNGIRTNYLEAGGGPGTEAVVLVHGSEPGVTFYASWRLVIPALAEDFHVIAPARVWGYQASLENMRKVLDVFAYSRQLIDDELADVRYQNTHSQSVESYIRTRPRAEDLHAGHAAGRAVLLISSIRDNSPTTARSTGPPRPGSSLPFRDAPGKELE